MAAPLSSDDPITIGPYRLTGRLGAGGMGTVYLAACDDGRPVAVKVINPASAGDAQFRARFRREVDAARLVRRFCTAPVIDASVEEAPFYIVTEYVAGPTLEEAVVRGGALHGADLEGLAVGTATALAAIHDAGLVHRDLKPSNVLLSAVGPRVIDFGIARALDSGRGVTRTGQLVGTPSYMAPEIVKGAELTPASDVFSWGCVIAFAGTGRGPFEGGTVPEILYRISHDPPRLDGLDPTLLPLVSRALSKEPLLRPTIAELLAAFTGTAPATESTLASVAATPEPAAVPVSAGVPALAVTGGRAAPAVRGADGSPFVAITSPSTDFGGRSLEVSIPPARPEPAPLPSAASAEAGTGDSAAAHAPPVPPAPQELATDPPAVYGPLPAHAMPPAPTVPPAWAAAEAQEPAQEPAQDAAAPPADDRAAGEGLGAARTGLRVGMLLGVVAGLLVVPLLAGVAWVLMDDAGADGGEPPPSDARLLSVPEGFFGAWHGRVVQAGAKDTEYEVTVTVTGGKLGEKVGTSEYPARGCTKDLTLTKADGVEILVVETGTGGGGCAGASPLTLSLTGAELVYGRNDPAGPTAVGALTR